MINFTRKFFGHKFCKKIFTRKMAMKKNFNKINLFYALTGNRTRATPLATAYSNH